MRRAVLLLCAALAAGCYFDSGIPWRHGRYGLLWIDDPHRVRLSVHAEGTSWFGLVKPIVFAVGADDRYIVAKQHPDGNKSITNYFIIEIPKDSPSTKIDHTVMGPLTADDFQKKSAELKLPPFSKVLASLE